jgi:hypothetical protein
MAIMRRGHASEFEMSVGLQALAGEQFEHIQPTKKMASYLLSLFTRIDERKC